MKRAELKKILKPLIKECIKEVIFEGGTLSTIISEVMKGTSTSRVIKESPAPKVLETNQQALERKQNRITEQRKRMLNAVGSDAYNGVNLFEGTTPMPSQGSRSSPHGAKPLDGISPQDPGIDISKFGMTGIWKKLAGN